MPTSDFNKPAVITDLVKAIDAQDMQTVQILLQSGADPNAPNKEGITPLTFAALVLDVQALELLLRAGADPNAPNRGGVTPLAAAVQRNDFEAVTLLLQVGANPNISDSAGTTLLSYAMEKGFWYVADYLVKTGATPPSYEGDPDSHYKYTGTTILPSDVLEEMKRETTLTYLIKKAGGYRSIFELLSNGANVNKLNKDSQSPLHIAVSKRPWPYVATQLVKRGAWIDPANPDPDEVIDTKTGATRLLAVIMEGVDALAVKDVLESGADPNKADDTGLTPLALARAYQWQAVEEMLLAKGADPNVTFPDANQMIGKDKNIPMILYAAQGQHCHNDYVRILLSLGANPDAADADGMTAAFQAGLHNNVWLLKLLKAAGADLFKPNNKGITGFDNACYNGHRASIEYLLAQAPKGILNQAHGEEVETTPFILAASRAGHAQVLEFLIGQGAEVNVRDKSGYTPLERAVMADDVDMVRLLLKHGAKTEAPLPKGEEFHNPLLYAVKYGSSNKDRLEIIQLLLDAGANPNITDEQGRTPAYWNITNAQGSAVSILKAAGADFFKDNNNGESAFDKACEYGHRRNDVKSILEGEPEDILSAEGRGKALCQASTVETLELLIKYGADVNVRDKRGLTALWYAIKTPAMVKALLKHGAKIDMPTLEGGEARAPLLVHLAQLSSLHAVEVAKILLDAGANPDATDERGYTAAMFAAEKGNMELLKQLNTGRADLYKVNNEGESALDKACEDNHFEIVKYLIAEAPEDFLSTGGDDLALVCAANDDTWNDHKGRSELMEFLITHGADVNAHNRGGHTPLEYAFLCDDPDMVRVLIKNGAKPETALPEDGKVRNPFLFHFERLYSPVHASEIVKMLVDAGADPNAVSVSEKSNMPVGASLLYSASSYTAYAKALLDNGADPHSTSAGGKSVAHKCINQNDIEMLKALLEKGLDPTRKFTYTETVSDDDGNERIVRQETSAYEHIQAVAAKKDDEDDGEDIETMLVMLKEVAEKIEAKREAERKQKFLEEQKEMCAENRKILRGKAPKIKFKP